MESSKVCKKCNENKLLSMFYKHKGMSDGFLSFCKSCVKDRVNKHRMENIDVIREKERNKIRTSETRKRAGEINKIWRNRDFRISIAHKMAQKSIKNGDIKKEPCVICGDEKSLAHHEDYNKPLDVVWYCMVHHKERHKQMVNEGIDPLHRIDEDFLNELSKQ